MCLSEIPHKKDWPSIMALWTLPTLPRLAQSENATVTHAKTDSFVLLAVAGDVRGVRERLRLKQEIDAPHSVSSH